MALPSLSTQEIRKIEGLLQGWTTKLTWELLLGRMETDLGIKTTRQTLSTYTSIKTMYNDRKQILRGKPSETLIKFTNQDVRMSERVERLEAELIAANRRIEHQQKFIGEMAFIAKTNPSVMSLMTRLKKRLQG